MRPTAPALLALALTATACSSAGGQDPETTASPPTTDATTLAAGEVSVPAAEAFGEPGFHEVIEISAAIPAGIPAGSTLTVRLRDAARPTQTCASEHPLSGCVTIDWSDFEDRPAVPAGGVFDNHLVVPLGSGSTTFFLSESGVLAPQPDAYSPG